jgi:DNA polymerase I
MKLVTTYGEKFIEQHLEPDGKVRTTFNVIVSTGRLSSRKPNMQNIPAKEAVGNRYRNCFIAEPGWCYVDSDYSSQELVVIAFISGDPVWNKALKEGKDLHSVCAEVVYKDIWKKAADPDCLYYKTQQKCKCKGHKRLRDNVKTINFGLIYGMSKFKLSASLGITLMEATQLIDEYFTKFPLIRKALTYMGLFGVRKGYIQTIAPFFRKRWFPYWRFARHCIEGHVTGMKYDSTLGSIERASKNMPIQGTSADMTKVAIYLMFQFIHEHNLGDKVKLVMQVHDQITTRVVQEYAVAWSKAMHEIMLHAAKFSITNGLLGAETNITPVWTK